MIYIDIIAQTNFTREKYVNCKNSAPSICQDFITHLLLEMLPMELYCCETFSTSGMNTFEVFFSEQKLFLGGVKIDGLANKV